MKIRGLFYLKTFLFFVLFSLNTYATTLISKTPTQIVQQSGFILEGEVLSKYSAFSDDQNTIYTFVTFTVRDVIKGIITQPTIELRFEGGQVDDDILDIPSTPKFEIGEKGILFVKPIMDSKTQCPVVGWEQGKFSIKIDTRNGTNIERMYDSHDNKIIGYDSKLDQFNISYTKPVDHINPIAIRNTPDRLVTYENLTEASAATAMTKDDFKNIIKNIVKKLQSTNKLFVPLPPAEKFKSIQMIPAAPGK